MTSSLKVKLLDGIRTGLLQGRDSFIWITKIILPVSFFVMLVQWSGLIYRANFVLAPMMHLINLPGEAAIPIIGCFLINIYAAIASMKIIPFSLGQMTMISVFGMIAHSLIPEGIIQRQCGIGAVKMTLIRIAAAVLSALFISQFFKETAKSVAIPLNMIKSEPFLTALRMWAVDTAILLGRMFVILMLIMVALGILRKTGWIEVLIKVLRPLTRLLGLSDRTTDLWLTASIFGLTYGAGVIIQEVKRGLITRDELECLHISIGINHSIVEDPALLLTLGISPLWLWVPRFVLAILAVHLNRLVNRLTKRRV